MRSSGSLCYVEAKVIHNGLGPHSYFEPCLIHQLRERGSVNGIGISVRRECGNLDHVPSDAEISQITDWLTTVDYGLVHDRCFPSREFSLGGAHYEVAAELDHGTGKFLFSVDYSSHRTIVPHTEDPMDEIVRKAVRKYDPVLLAGVPLVLAILNCSRGKHLDGKTEAYGIEYLRIDKVTGDTVEHGYDGSGLWRTNRKKEEIYANRSGSLDMAPPRR